MEPAFRVQLWGVRGSIPAPSAATRFHGGNTPCVSVQATDGHRFVLDAGTGIRALGDEIVRDAAREGRVPDVHVFLTHAHSDHLQGLPFFAPLFTDGARITLHVARALRAPIEHAIRAQMGPPAFPVSFDALHGTLAFDDVPDEGIVIGGTRIRAVTAEHPGGAVGWSLQPQDDMAPTIVYLPDNEIAAASPATRDAWRDALRGTRLLLHDTTYSPTEAPSRGGWGHSTWEETVRFAADIGAERVVLFHHHPDRSDDAIERIVDDARSLAMSLGSTPQVVAAAEGLVLHVGRGRA